MARDEQRCFSSLRPCLAFAVMALICAAPTTAQPQQPPALPNLPAACPPPQATLSPCISYFFGNSNSSSPPAACCDQMRSMFESQATCLCAAMASAPSQLGSAFGQAQALLPSACNLPANACSGTTAAPGGSGSTTPASGTAAVPSPATTEPTGVDPTAAGGGLKSVPGLFDSAAVSNYRDISAAIVMISLFVAYLS